MFEWPIDPLRTLRALNSFQPALVSQVATYSSRLSGPSWSGQCEYFTPSAHTSSSSSRNAAPWARIIVNFLHCPIPESSTLEAKCTFVFAALNFGAAEGVTGAAIAPPPTTPYPLGAFVSVDRDRVAFHGRPAVEAAAKRCGHTYGCSGARRGAPNSKSDCDEYIFKRGGCSGARSCKGCYC